MQGTREPRIARQQVTHLDRSSDRTESLNDKSAARHSMCSPAVGNKQQQHGQQQQQYPGSPQWRVAWMLIRNGGGKVCTASCATTGQGKNSSIVVMQWCLPTQCLLFGCAMPKVFFCSAGGLLYGAVYRPDPGRGCAIHGRRAVADTRQRSAVGKRPVSTQLTEIDIAEHIEDQREEEGHGLLQAQFGRDFVWMHCRLLRREQLNSERHRLSALQVDALDRPLAHEFLEMVTRLRTQWESW